jgi:hypothetical protein
VENTPQEALVTPLGKQRTGKHVAGDWLGWAGLGWAGCGRDSNGTMISSIVLVRAWLDLYSLFFFFLICIIFAV